MLAVTFGGLKQVAVTEVPIPRLEEPGDVIVRVLSCAICGSDLHPYHCRELCDEGTVFGHEFVGEIAQLGEELTIAANGIVDGVGNSHSADPTPAAAPLRYQLALGQRVFAPFTTACGDCFQCRAGLSARCAQARLFGWRLHGSGLHGGQTQYVRVPLAASTLLPLPEGVHPEEALLLGDIFTTAVFCAVNAGLAGWSDDGSAAGALSAFMCRWDASTAAAAAGASRKGADIAQGGAGPTAAANEVAADAKRQPRCYVVVGCGPVGLLTVILAKQLLRMRARMERYGSSGVGGGTAAVEGEDTVIAVDSIPSRLAVAAKCGAVPVQLPTVPTPAVTGAEPARAAAIRSVASGNGPGAAPVAANSVTPAPAPGAAAATAVLSAIAETRKRQFATTAAASSLPAHALPPAGADAVMECVGAPSALQLAFTTLRPGGTLSSVGVHTAPTFPFTPGDCYDKNITFRSGRCPVRSLLPYSVRLLQLIKEHGIDVRGLIISHRMPLSQAAEAYRMFDAREEGCTKVVLLPWAEHHEEKEAK